MKRFSVDYLIHNNKVVAVFSLIIAAIIWLFVAVEKSPIVTTVIENVPVTIDLQTVEKFGLSCYGDTEITANVTVTGKRYIVEDDNIRDSISVIANTDSVVDSGNYTLSIETSQVSKSSSFEIVSVSPQEISVFFDAPVTDKEFLVEPIINHTGAYLVPPNYFAGDPIVAKSAEKIKVSGPASEVRKIEKIVAEIEVGEPLTQSESFTVEYKVITTDAESLQYVSYDKTAPVTVKLPVYKRTAMRTVVDYSNKPLKFADIADISCTVHPSTVNFGVAESKLENMEGLLVKNIDFSQLAPGENKFTVKASEVEKLNSCVIFNNVEEFTVTVNVENMTTKVITIPNDIGYNASSEKITVESITPNFTTLTLVGPEEVLEDITAEDVLISADLSKVDESMEGTMTAKIVLSGNDSYWIYGDYTATVEIK